MSQQESHVRRSTCAAKSEVPRLDPVSLHLVGPSGRRIGQCLPRRFKDGAEHRCLQPLQHLQHRHLHKCGDLVEGVIRRAGRRAKLPFNLQEPNVTERMTVNGKLQAWFR